MPLSSSKNSQLTLFEMPPASNIVNVASVPQRSPFRYPGGKTWLIPQIREWFAQMPKPPAKLVEPFAGGGIVSLTTAFEKLAEHVILIELDDEVAVVWKCILGGGAEQLAERILHFDLTLKNIKNILALENPSLDEKAFRTILKNRVFHGGILAPGSGLIKSGENGKGLSSRWYPETLAKRIKAIDMIRERVTFIHGDAFDAIEEFGKYKDTVFFIDPLILLET